MSEQAELGELRANATRLTATARRWVALRLWVFLIALAAGLGAIATPWLLWSVSAPLVAIFPVLIVLHQRTDRQLARVRHELLLHEEEDARREDRAPSRAAPRAQNAESPLTRGENVHSSDGATYALDEGAIDDLMVLSGPHSLFGLLDTSSSWFGARRLAYLLSHPLLSIESIAERQRAVAALAQADAKRRALLAALLELRTTPLESAPATLRRPVEFAERRLLQFVADALGTLVPLFAILLVVTGVWWPTFWPVVLFAVILGVCCNVVLVGACARQSNPARDRIARLAPAARVIPKLGDALRANEIPGAEWTSVTNAVAACEGPARTLGRQLYFLELHEYGAFFELLNLLTLFELRALPRAERAIVQHRATIERALSAIGEVEALLSLSCALAERRGFRLPEVCAAPTPFVEAQDVQHPLLAASTRVGNPIQLTANQRILVITGSNMAGKSTYLRAVGVNVLLACCGAAVCAARFKLTPLRIATDVNLRDSLDDGKSYFQVEVERIHAILRAARDDKFLLAIFDELFRGTNATERFGIAWALIEELREAGALVLLATHDDRLARRVEDAKHTTVRNGHFSERVATGALAFDYKLEDGRATSRNAIRVLEATGFPAPLIERARAAVRELDSPAS
ncbi:MAG: MutS-related protein [Planctomycetota bacterium]